MRSRLPAQSVATEQLAKEPLLSTCGPTARRSRLGVSTAPIALLEDGVLRNT